MNTVFIHSKECNGGLILDLTSGIRLMSPSFRINGDKVLPGLVDILKTNSDKKELKWYCSKCHQDVSQEEMLENSLVECSVCGNPHPLKEIISAPGLFGICSDCLKIRELMENGIPVLDNLDLTVVSRLSVMPKVPSDSKTFFDTLQNLSLD